MSPIEVKGHTTICEIALTTSEYKTAERLTRDYRLYVVFNCSSVAEVLTVQDPSCMGWELIIRIERCHVGAEKIFGASK